MTYELTPGAVLLGVAALCQHLTNGSGVFDATTQPTLTAVTNQIVLANAKTDAELMMFGYASDQTGAAEAVIGLLQQLVILETVIWVELANPITGDGEPNERFKAFVAERDAILDIIHSEALVGLGATPTESGPQLRMAASGISRSRKQAVAADTDILPARFGRGFGQNTRAGVNINDADLVERPAG